MSKQEDTHTNIHSDLRNVCLLASSSCISKESTIGVRKQTKVQMKQHQKNLQK